MNQLKDVERTLSRAGRMRRRISRSSTPFGPYLQLDPHYTDSDPRGHRWRAGLLAFYLVTTLAYLSYRPSVFNNDAFIFSLAFYAAEVSGFVFGLVLIVVTWRRPRHPVLPAPKGLAVDVFVTVYDEPLNVIRRTALAATRISYPHETWLLDDGNRPQVRAIAEELGCRYLPRTINKGAKAGNLNNGLRHATGDFVAVFDADHVAQHDFLHRLLGYFADEKVSFVQTPQDYFNLDSFQYGRNKKKDLIWHDQSYFHYVGQTGRDHWNATTFCGCSAVLRRSALDEIGGFPEETVTEDMHAAVRFHKRGLKSVFHPEPLAFGIAPPDLAGYLKQRLRWGEGNMQVCREESLPFSRQLSLMQLICYFGMTTPYLEAWQRIIYCMAPVVVLFTQIPPIWGDLGVYCAFFIPHLVASLLLDEELARGFGRFFAKESYAMARIGSSLLTILGLFRKRIRFRVSSKELSGRVPVLLLAPHFLIAGSSIAAIVYTLARPVIGDPLYMPLGVTIAVVCLALYNVALAGRVIVAANRVVGSDEEEYAHPVPLPLGFRQTGGGRDWRITEDISVEKIVLDGPAPISAEGPLTARLLLPDGPMDLLLERAAANERHSGAVFRILWQSQAERDRLELILHAGRWYRPLTGKHEFISTPSEWTARLLARRAKEWRKWEPVVLGGQPHAADEKLAFRSADPIHGTRLITFGDAFMGDAVFLRGRDQADATYRRTREQSHDSIPDGIALEIVGGRIHAVEPVEAIQHDKVLEGPVAIAAVH